ncbi:unnamed protein product [Acanthosepion pharaonis]|uniref:Uncharacterized protein n=1 Tax=Acanthosepion pharaonis TaxID=158019 RepID=A0A812EXH3_ACAPH|nr:unnamed protein product [Sepia pharaonis]
MERLLAFTVIILSLSQEIRGQLVNNTTTKPSDKEQKVTFYEEVEAGLNDDDYRRVNKSANRLTHLSEDFNVIIKDDISEEEDDEFDKMMAEIRMSAPTVSKIKKREVDDEGSGDDAYGFEDTCSAPCGCRPGPQLSLSILTSLYHFNPLFFSSSYTPSLSVFHTYHKLGRRPRTFY